MFLYKFVTVSLIFLHKSKISSAARTDESWDYLLFSQRWPISSCIEWEEKKSGNTCNLPQDKSFWSIHGIWPTKFGTEGPVNCNSAAHFDPKQLDPLLPALENQWVNVEANTKPYSFWEHEWKKHGTCAIQLPVLNSVYNYFKQGLVWNKDYDLSGILSSQSIVPQAGGGYDLVEIYNALVTKLGKRPTVQCVIDSKTKQSLISEIRICFNKSMELIDCDPKNPNHVAGDVLGNCDAKKLVMYFSSVPNPEGDFYDEINMQIRDIYEKRLKLMNFYRLLNFFIWFTL